MNPLKRLIMQVGFDPLLLGLNFKTGIYDRALFRFGDFGLETILQRDEEDAPVPDRWQIIPITYHPTDPTLWEPLVEEKLEYATPPQIAEALVEIRNLKERS